MADENVPGTATESVLLVESDSCENFASMSSSLEEIKFSSGSKVVGKNEQNEQDEETVEDGDKENIDGNGFGDDNDNWAEKRKHIFVLSSAGKPIYTRYGNEDKLAAIFGVMQALVSVVQDQQDSIQSIHAGNTKYVFLIKGHLILVAVSKTEESVGQLTTQLTYVFNQIASTLTLTRLNKIFEQRRNFDLRRLLAGVERLIDHLLDFFEQEPALTLGSVQCLPLASSIRDSISSAISQSCSKIKNLVFAILLANNKLITLVRMKKYAIHPTDLHLIFNLVQSSSSFKTAETWTPICLPRFDASGFLYGHVSYLSEDCQACLLLLTVERDMFFPLKEAKQKIVEKLRRANCLEGINDSLNAPDESCAAAGFPELRHYLYKSKSTAQFYQPAVGPPYNINKDRLLSLYKRAHQRLHGTSRPLKLSFERGPHEAVLAWDTKGFELYVVLEPLVETSVAIATISRLLNWIKKREERLFHLNAPTF